MTYKALVDSFAGTEDLPVRINDVLAWIRTSTDYKDIRLHPVDRGKKAFRGACRRISVPKGPAYSGDFDIVTQIIYAKTLPEEWKRLVICKELLHIFDPQGQRVNTPEAVTKLITSIIAPELKGLPFLPALNDQLGAFKAMAVLLPRAARLKLQRAYETEHRSVTEIASFASLPPTYVEIWLREGEQLEELLCQI